MPKLVGAVEAFRVVPGLLAQFAKRVPGEFFLLDGDAAVVACPCGVDPPPRVPFNRILPCDTRALEVPPLSRDPRVPEPEAPPLRCYRWFFFDGRNVRVMTDPSAPPRPPVD